ncbi:MAG: hypothetical protein ACK41E_06465 [Deinococcales bacterium]
MKRRFWILLFSGWFVAFAQTIAPVDRYYDLAEIATLNQAALNLNSARATLRFAKRIVYLFANSPELIVDGQDVRLNEPVLLVGQRWLVPRALLEALQLKASKPVDLQNQAVPFELSWEELELKAGVRGLHLFYTSEFNTQNDASLFLMPFEQVAKLDNGLGRDVQKIITGLTQVQAGQVLYFSVALEPEGNPIGLLEFIQGNSRYSVENGAGLLSLSGKFPQASLGAIKLPNSFDLRQPIRVVWGDSSADYVFL